MNFLGHLYFSHDNHELMVANLFGDHFYGKHYTHLPEIIQQGILLHRQIDDYTDTHPAVKSLRLALYQELPKVAGIAIDLYFDHLLASNWVDFHTTPYADYLNEFYAYQSVYINQYPRDFCQFLDQLKVKKWMNHYGSNFGLLKSCEGVGNRLSFPNALHLAPDVYKENSYIIESTFHEFMHDACSRFNIT